MPPSPIRMDGPKRANERPAVRGFAVLSGVLLYSGWAVSVAVRRPSGEVVSRVRSRRPISPKLLRVPLLRGVVAFLQASSLYLWGSLFALSQAELMGPLANAAVGNLHLPTSRGPSLARLRAWRILLASIFWFSLGLMLVLGGMPVIFAELAKGAPTPLAAALCHVVGACAAAGLLTGYVSLVGHSSSLTAMLAYHGAEHQVRAAYEAQAPLTLAQVRRFPSTHTGCVMGRAVVVTLLGFAVAASVAWVWAPVDAVLRAADVSWMHLCGATSLRAVAVILATGPYHELQRLLTRRSARTHAAFAHVALVGPGLWLSAASTSPPKVAHSEVALVAMMRLLDAQSAFDADAQAAARAPKRFHKLAGACVRSSGRRHIAPLPRCEGDAR